MKSPLLYSYLRRWQEDPTSRVFAPLSEAYRKAGLTEEAIEIAEEGLKVHPHYAPGKVALARAWVDQGEFKKAADALGTLTRDSPDNLSAQRLLAECCLMLGRESEALLCYKQILFYHPTDSDAVRLVWELETRAYQGGEPLVKPEQPDPANRFRVVDAKEALEASPEFAQREWMRKIEFLQELLLNLHRSRYT